jgi:hypothetical protein
MFAKKVVFPVKFNRVQFVSNRKSYGQQIVCRFVREIIRVDGLSPSDLLAIRIPIRFCAQI